MSSIEEATRAVTELHDKEFMGRRLVVSGAKTTERIAA
jgi:RNA recognition motif-containing protein